MQLSQNRNLSEGNIHDPDQKYSRQLKLKKPKSKKQQLKQA